MNVTHRFGFLLLFFFSFAHPVLCAFTAEDWKTATPEEREALLEERRQTLLRIENADRELYPAEERWIRLPVEEQQRQIEESRQHPLNLRAQAQRERLDRIWEATRGMNAEERRAFMEADRAERRAERESASDGAAGNLGKRPEAFVDQWQFRSVAEIGADRIFSLVNPWTEEAFWGSVGKEKHGITITAFEPGPPLLVIRHREELRRLLLR